MRDIGKNIKQLRTDRDMTQEELAEQLFVTRQTVSNYEMGKSRPDIDMLERIAQVLGSDIQTVIYGPQPKGRNPEVRQLAVSCGVMLLLGILLAVISPTEQELARNRVDVLGQLTFVLKPLYFLLLGWVAARLLGTALKKKPITSKAAGWAGNALAALLVIWFVVQAACYPVFGCEWTERAVYAVYGFCYRLSIPYQIIYLLPGGALWLLGIPGRWQAKGGESHA